MRRVTETEVLEDFDNVKECLDSHCEWAILLIEGGKVMGSGYGYNIEHNSEGAGYVLAVRS